MIKHMYKTGPKFKRDAFKAYAKDKQFFHDQLVQIALKFLVVLFVITHFVRVDTYRFKNLTMLMPFERFAPAIGFVMY